jgi:hypothetical protein
MSPLLVCWDAFSQDQQSFHGVDTASSCRMVSFTLSFPLSDGA